MHRLIIIVGCVLMVGCGTPRELPKTPVTLDFPSPIYTDGFPSPDKVIGINFSDLRNLRPSIQKVYLSSNSYFEYHEVLTNHPYFSSINYFVNANQTRVYKVEYAQNADVHNDPAYRLALLDQLLKTYGNPLVSKKSDIYIFNADKYVLKLQNQTLSCISKNIEEYTTAEQ